MAKRSSSKKMRDGFLAWQCLIRQTAMREDGGRPSSGMRPRVLDAEGRELAPAVTVLLIPKKPEESTAFFRFQVMKSADPREVYERALTYLQANYFQTPERFSDKLEAVLSSDSNLAKFLVDDGFCILEFVQGRRRYYLPCKTRGVEPGDPACDAAIWHNRLFNPALPNAVQVISFKPDWSAAEAGA